MYDHYWDLWPGAVAEFPEMAVLAALYANLETAAVALEAAHPELDEGPEVCDKLPMAGSLQIARSMLITSNCLLQLLDAYRSLTTTIASVKHRDEARPPWRHNDRNIPF